MQKKRSTDEILPNKWTAKMPVEWHLGLYCIPEEIRTLFHPRVGRGVEVWTTFGKSPGGFIYSCF